MQIVIDISEDDYRKAQDGRASVSIMRKAIANGIPLPEGHGRLIDADDLLDNTCLDEIPTIIEADEAESEVQDVT